MVHAQVRMASKGHSDIVALELILTQALACRLWGVRGRNSWSEFQLQLQELGFRGGPCAQTHMVWSAALQSGGLVLC